MLPPGWPGKGEVAHQGPPQRASSHSIPGQGLAHHAFNIVFLQEKIWFLMQVTAASSLPI